MSKKHKDISTYFLSNKKHKANIDKNVSQPSTTDSSNNSDNNELETNNNNEVPATTCLLPVNENSNTTINVSVNDNDIGLYVSNKLGMNDFLLLNRLLVKPWTPPSNYVYPKVELYGKNQSVCQHSWLLKYSWLAYSEMHQGVYCRYCVLFSRQGDYQSLGQFINKPLRSLKDAMEYLSVHDKCSYHMFSVTQATECVQRFSHPNSGVNTLLNDIDVQQQNENRLILASIIKCILFLGQQNIAFRGNDDDGLPDYDNTSKGNFKSLILFRAEAGDQVLQKHLHHHQKNATYIGSNIQNELITICANSIRKCLLNELITQNKFYAVIADETADISGTEQLSISIRFVSDENDISIKEIFLGFTALSNLTAVGLTEAIITTIKKYGLSIEKLRGQGYDGASVVAGRLGGVQKLIRDVAPRAVYVHCSNHSLDLVIAQACTLQVIKSFFGTIKSIITFINGSPKRKTMLAKAIESTINETKRRHLVKLCETRWVEKHTSIIVFKQVYFGVVIALDYLVENGDSETSGLARSYGKALTDIDFAVPLIIVNRVFCITKPYAEQLQKPTCDLLQCYQNIEQASLYLAELIYDDNPLDELYNEFTLFVERNEIDNRLSRTTGRRYQTTKDYFTDVYKTFINMTLEELGRRFTEHQKVAMNISKLIPSYIANTQFSDVSTLFSHYKDDLQTDDTSIHKAEFDTWKFTILKMQENERPSTISETLKMIQHIKVFYPNIYILLQIYALIPVSVAGAERSFSVLKLIKTYLRNRTGDERLSSLAVINIHKNIAQKLNVEDIIDEFAKLKRKLNFMNELN